MQARMNAKMTRKFTSIIAESDCAFVIITHLTTQIGSMSRDPLIVAGGNAILYAAGITLDLRQYSIQESDPIKKEDGIKIHVKCTKNHCVPNRNPYLQTDYFAIFGEGIEQHLETLDNAIEQGIIHKGGAYYKEVDSDGEVVTRNGEKLQWLGKKAYKEYCKANPDYFENLIARIEGKTIQISAEEIKEIEQLNKDIEAGVADDIKKSIKNNKKKKK